MPIDDGFAVQRRDTAQWITVNPRHVVMIADNVVTFSTGETMEIADDSARLVRRALGVDDD